MSGVENFTFENSENRESLRQIKEIQRTAKAERKKHISDTIISSLNWEWLIIASWDTLAHISALTAVWNRLSFNNEADDIEIWDRITIWPDKEDPNKRALFRNGTKVWEVLEGYEVSTSFAIASVRRDVEDIIPRSERWRQYAEVNESHDWTLLANYISERGYPIWKNGAYCGQNVGNMLSLFGSPQLPSWGRHGYRWTSFLDWNPGFTKVRINSPSEAEAGGICVYDKWFGYTDERMAYGHVEIALWNGEFYYWSKRNRPGWSIDASRNPDNSGFTWYVYYPVTSKFDDMMMV